MGGAKAGTISSGVEAPAAARSLLAGRSLMVKTSARPALTAAMALGPSGKLTMRLSGTPSFLRLLI